MPIQVDLPSRVSPIRLMSLLPVFICPFSHLPSRSFHSLHHPLTAFGMYQFRYKIVTANGQSVEEGLAPRTENRLQEHFYHAFRPNHTEFRVRPTYAIAGAVRCGARGSGGREGGLVRGSGGGGGFGAPCSFVTKP